MSIDSEPQVEGELVQDQTLITSKAMQQSLEQKGYGELSKKEFFLKPFESLYLLYCDKLKLSKGKKRIDFDSLMQTCIKQDAESLTKFLIYRDLRTRGYTVKDGFGFGSDFRVYERGDFGEKAQNIWYLVLMKENKKKLVSFKKRLNRLHRWEKNQ